MTTTLVDRIAAGLTTEQDAERVQAVINAISNMTVDERLRVSPADLANLLSALAALEEAQ